MGEYDTWMVMIPDGIDITFDTIYTQIEKRFSHRGNVVAARSGTNGIQLQIDGWEFQILWEAQSHVVDESKGIAESYAKGCNKEIIASSKCRIVTYALSSDPDFRYINDYISVREVLEAISGLYHFDQLNGELWKSEGGNLIKC